MTNPTLFRAAAISAKRRSVFDDVSVEATAPRPAEIRRLVDLMPPGTRVYLSTLPHTSHDRQLAAAAEVRSVGLEPVPHLAARYFRSENELADYLAKARERANVRRLMMIGGDIEHARGPFASSLDIMNSDAFVDAGIAEIGVAGYPEGHPKIGDRELLRVLQAKTALAAGLGIDLHIVTQFCFDAGAIAAWLSGIRDAGVRRPVRVGIAGPANAATLLKFALRCGVDLPLRKAGLAVKLLGGHAPDAIVRELDARGIAGDGTLSVATHLYSFGGLERTATWAMTAAASG